MRRFIPVVLAIILALAPALAEARPGMGLSLGSRGSQTWSSTPGASPFQRSMTPNTYGNSAYGNSAFGGGGFGGRGGMRGGFMSGLLGGLIGAGIGGMLFGHGFFGFHGGTGFLGLLLQLVLLYFLARWVMRRFMGVPAMAGGPGDVRAQYVPAAGATAAGDGGWVGRAAGGAGGAGLSAIHPVAAGDSGGVVEP